MLVKLDLLIGFTKQNLEEFCTHIQHNSVRFEAIIAILRLGQRYSHM
jgi:hypothetical protein